MSAIVHPPGAPEPASAAPAAGQPALTAFDWLRRFAGPGKSRLGALRSLAPAEMPLPFRSLLVHGHDMTSTLERFYRERLQITVLRRDRPGSFYVREVILSAGGRPVEYGVICIRLGAFAPTLQREIVAERLPLGRLLHDHAVPYISRPQDFFRLDGARYIEQFLEAPGPGPLFGRRNLLLTGGRRLLADVVEILAPAAARHAGGEVPGDFSGRLGQVLDDTIEL